MSGYTGDDIYEQPAPAAEPSAKGKGLHQETRVKSRLGLGTIVDNRMFRHDRNAARANPTDWHIAKDDRADADFAADLIQRVQDAYGISAADPSEIEAFWEAMQFYHTANSGSVAQPARSWIRVSGTKFYYHDMLNILGTDQRRFFRALANEVREVNKKVLADAGKRDIEARERYEWLMQVAHERGLSRYPDLAHDSADACWSLDPAQRAAVANSKLAVMRSTSNFVDTVSSNARVMGQRGTITDNPAVGRGYDE